MLLKPAEQYLPPLSFECPCLRGETHIRTSTPLTRSKSNSAWCRSPSTPHQSDTDATPAGSIRFVWSAEVSIEPSSIPTNLKNQSNQPTKKQGSEHVAEIQPSWSINNPPPNPFKSQQSASSDGLFAGQPGYVNAFRRMFDMFPSQILISLIFNFVNQTEKLLVFTDIKRADRLLSRIIETGMMTPAERFEIDEHLPNRGPSLCQLQHVCAAH